jgi:multicomponent Na+:H+ antiporter subunit G
VASAGSIVTAVLLVCGVAVVVACCVGVAVMRGAYARLHFTAPAGLGALLIAVAIVVQEGFSLIGDKALLIAAFVLVTSPVLSHITGRAARIRAASESGSSSRADRRDAGSQPWT